MLDQDTIAKATGGGNVLAAPTYPNTVASFGLNARRPVGFSGGGNAEGRINYDRHRNTTGRHVNAPVVLMTAMISGTPTPNGTGGKAALVADCTAIGATCPSGDQSAVVYIEDNGDSGAGVDIFKIQFCETFPTLPPDNFSGGQLPGCDGPEGGTLRSGNVQIRALPGAVGETMTTAASAGIFPAAANFNGVELAGGVIGVGARSGDGSVTGDIEVQFTGMSLLGLSQLVTITGWITSGSIAGGTATLNGTATLDMGDGPPPTGGHSLVVTVTSTGITVNVGGTTLPTLPKSDGFIVIE
ncbi:MAG TPA: hypothetical protein VJP45_07400 [Candidatus Limnocylindria bacterium]|nr:hypothetical protein [Candidatus Limnocylindria bacterium]